MNYKNEEFNINKQDRIDIYRNKNLMLFIETLLDFINKNHEVISFKKNIPSMEEIFIKVVEDA